MIRVLSISCGLLMVAAVGIGTHGQTLVAAVLAAAAVVAGTVFRPAATLAVLLTVAAVVLANPAPTVAAVSGLAAAGYLVLRHATGLDMVSGASILGAVGFTLAGLVATAFPLELPWLPLVAPLAILAIYVVAIRPFTADPGDRGLRPGAPPDGGRG
ncbi:hypothetical protein [Mycobacterium celatum]|uniref:Integral membrane protein n=1 Tax=Mycobacterium celatum TaxID=28045 RepID=A0A1X1RUB4_MYCCE|nr:hypothetical protein [Mycobacterium celatum]ORV18038.1 hypothetical protein AWB95_04250 [Mycobacterium celatum]PIB80441.1 hypothetical protein CQY23_02495 [Mycobacterium celatum]